MPTSVLSSVLSSLMAARHAELHHASAARSVLTRPSLLAYKRAGRRLVQARALARALQA